MPIDRISISLAVLSEIVTQIGNFLTVMQKKQKWVFYSQDSVDSAKSPLWTHRCRALHKHGNAEAEEHLLPRPYSACKNTRSLHTSACFL